MTRDDFAASCNLQAGFSIAEGNVITISGGEMTLQSIWEDTSSFSVTLKDAQLLVTKSNTDSTVIGSCKAVSGRSGDHGTYSLFDVCDFGPRAAISGNKISRGAGFTAKITFQLMTLTAHHVVDSDISNSETVAGTLVLNGPLSITSWIDSDSMVISEMAVIQARWTPTLTSDGGAIVAFEDSAIFSSLDGVLPAFIPHSNIPWDMVRDAEKGNSPRQILRDEAHRAFPM